MKRREALGAAAMVAMIIGCAAAAAWECWFICKLAHAFREVFG